MNYRRIYELLCERGKSRRRKGFDRHHIIPKSHGGTNSPDNLTNLTRREHILAHRLLWKISGDPLQKVACNALPYAELGARGSTAWRSNPEFLKNVGSPIPKEVRELGVKEFNRLRVTDPEWEAARLTKMARTKSQWVYVDSEGREFLSVRECALANNVPKHYVENGVRRGHHGFWRYPRDRSSEPV